MRVLAHFHKFPPHHNAGAEFYALELFRFLTDHGHDVTVLARDTDVPYDIDGIAVLPGKTERLARHYADTDIVVTHLDLTRTAIGLAKRASKPVMHLVHNDRQLTFNRVRPGDAAIIVCNSEWIRRAIRWRGRHVLVARPLVRVDHYRVDVTPDNIVLVNLTKPKGAELFYALAERMPTRTFVGVRGAYGAQIDPPTLPNLSVIDTTSDIRPVYANARVMLMPSSYESWGRVGIEAAASGIPTIAHPTPGLLESLGDAGLFADLEDWESWEELIDRLDNGHVMRAWRAAATRRAQRHEQAALRELAVVERTMREVVP